MQSRRSVLVILHSFAIASILCVPLAGTQTESQQSKGTPEDEAAVRSALLALEAAINSHDAKRLSTLFSQDAAFISPRGTLSSQAEIAEFFADVLTRRPWFSWTFTRIPPPHFIRPNEAVVISTVEMRERPNSAESITRQVTTVLTKEGDSWLVVFLSESELKPDASITVFLKSGTDDEIKTAQQLLGLFRTYDVSKWLFVSELIIQEGVTPNSFQMITLNVRRRDSELDLLKLLSTFIHEEIHQSFTDVELLKQAKEELVALFPGVPITPPEGAGSESSNYLHLIVCHLEHTAMRELVGEDKAKRVMEAKGYYKSIYRIILAESAKIHAVIQRFHLESHAPASGLLSPTVEITSPARDHYERGETVTLRAKASASRGTRVRQVDFLIDGLPVAVDTESPYEYDWRQAAVGRHVTAARVHDSGGYIGVSGPETLFIGIRALERCIARSEDDAEESMGGSMSLTSSDLDLINHGGANGGDQIVGIRFTNIQIPKSTQIKKAYLQFTVDERGAESTELTIHAELAASAVAFSKAQKNISSRKRTSASIKWSPRPWRVKGEQSEKQRTPDLSALIQEVTSQPDWQQGNAIVFIISGSGKRVAESHDGDRNAAPVLYVELN